MKTTLVCCGAPLAARIDDLAAYLHTTGHEVTTLVTDAARRWTGRRDPSSSPRRPDLLVVAPATFHTLNAWAAGLNSTPVLGVLNEALARPATRVIVVPFVNDDLAAHPVYTSTLDRLVTAGVELVDPHDGARGTSPRPISSGTGDDVAGAFQPRWLTASAVASRAGESLGG